MLASNPNTMQIMRKKYGKFMQSDLGTKYYLDDKHSLYSLLMKINNQYHSTKVRLNH